jgi:hypothetical protein
MVVAVNEAASALRRDLVEVVAEARHVAGGVLVAREDLVDGVEDYHRVAPVLRAADELRRELVERHRLAAQVPRVYHVEVRGRYAELPVDCGEAV